MSADQVEYYTIRMIDYTFVYYAHLLGRMAILSLPVLLLVLLLRGSAFKKQPSDAVCFGLCFYWFRLRLNSFCITIQSLAPGSFFVGLPS